MQRTLFDVNPKDLGDLAPDVAVAVLREMLWAECYSLGLAVTEADVPFAINDADGGIDGIIRALPAQTKSELLFPPQTSYQVKTGNFNLKGPTEIEELLVRPSSIQARRSAKKKLDDWKYTSDDLSPRVRACFDAGGTFVTLLFGSAAPEEADREGEARLKAFLAGVSDGRYATASIKIWRQTQICGLLKRFPAVAARLLGRYGLPLARHADWAQRADMVRPFVTADPQTAKIELMRKALRDRASGSVHIRVCGEPGIGKTRLVLEATRAPDLQATILYADNPEVLFNGVLPQIEGVADQVELTLVVDECDPEQRTSLSRRFKGRGPNVKVVSIYQDEDEADRSADYRLIEAPSLPDDQIIAIFRQYGISDPDLEPWARECQGSPRVAHVVAANLRINSGQPLSEDGLERVWTRFLAGGEDPSGAIYRHRHLVLSSLALFKRFGYSHHVRDQAYEVHALIVQQLEPGLSRAEFDSIIDTLRARKVLQGEHVLYITPKLFHMRLWMDWWKKYAAALKDRSELPKKLSANMRDWFGEMFEYAKDAPAARELVSSLFGKDGPFRDVQWLKTDEGGRFFFHLSRADPRRGLEFLKRAIATQSVDQLRDFSAGRRSVIWALEGMAVFPELFLDAARMMLRLAEAENETWSNNASGMFADLFSLSWGEAAPTALAPDQRLPVLLEAFSSGESQSLLAIKAFSRALSVHGHARLVGHEWYATRGVRRWLPQTYGELYEAYRLYWRTLKNQLNRLPDKVAREGLKTLLNNARGLCSIPALAGEIADDLGALTRLSVADARDVIETIEEILHYDRKSLEPAVREHLLSLRDRLIGSGFASRLRRYAGMDLLEDKFDDEGKHVDKAAPQLARLAEEAISTPDVLEPELQWLVTQDAKNGYQFGVKLGEIDNQLSSWPAILKAWISSQGENRSDLFVGGYLSAIFRRSPTTWEKIVEQIAREPMVRIFVASVIWRSGMTERVATLLLQLAERRVIEPRSLHIFSYGQTSANVPQGVLSEWLQLLINDRSFFSATAALELLHMSSLNDPGKFRAELLHDAIFNPALFSGEAGGHRETMVEHHWVEVAKRLLKAKPSEALPLARLILENFGNEHSPIDGYWGQSRKLLDEIVGSHPDELWSTVANLIGPPMDSRAFYVTRWLRGADSFSDRRPGALMQFPRPEIWKWLEEDPEKRAHYLSSFAPKEFTVDTWDHSLLRELLVKFGSRPEVRSAVWGNFFTGGWTGPSSLHYEGQTRLLRQLQKIENDPNVLLWLSETIDELERLTTESKIEEEARGF